MQAYGGDFSSWTQETARRLRAGEFEQLDLVQIAEEIEDMGRSDGCALGSRLKVQQLLDDDCMADCEDGRQ